GRQTKSAQLPRQNAAQLRVPGWFEVDAVLEVGNGIVAGQPVARADKRDRLLGGDPAKECVHLGTATATVVGSAGQRPDHCQPGTRIALLERSEEPVGITRDLGVSGLL